MSTYGVDTREEGGALTFFESDEIASPDIPLLISGRALPEVPATHRTIFQLVPLHIAQPDYVRLARSGRSRARTWRSSRNLLATRSVLFLQGGADIIARAVDMLEVLDQPLLQGQHGLILQPELPPCGQPRLTSCARCSTPRATTSASAHPAVP